MRTVGGFFFFSQKVLAGDGGGGGRRFFSFFSKNRAACEGGLRVPLEGGTQDAQEDPAGDRRVRSRSLRSAVGGPNHPHQDHSWDLDAGKV
jgi:hypothetical protein